jgi:hypothetical protein
MILSSSSYGAKARHIQAALAGAGVGALGGLIGLGGAEFRLPLLIGLFGFAALAAVILNKAMSLMVVASALLFRTRSVPLDQLVEHWPIVVNLLSGSLLGAWYGASGYAGHPRTLYRVIAGLLISWLPSRCTNGCQRLPSFLDRAGRGRRSCRRGHRRRRLAARAAGGELLIPTTVPLFAVDNAGPACRWVSLPR